MSTQLLVHVVDNGSDAVVTILNDAGFATRAHFQARSFFRDYQPAKIGCVICEMVLPDATGFEVQERIARSAHKVPLILTAAEPNVTQAVTAMKLGAVDFLEKPIEAAQLLDRVGETLKQRQFELPALNRLETAQSRLGVLSPREKDVLRELLAGRTNKTIARELGVSPRTIECHRAKVMEKTGADNLAALVRLAIDAGIGPEFSVRVNGG